MKLTKAGLGNLLLLFFAAFFTTTTNSQSLIKSLAFYNANYPVEKTYVQFDKAAYSEGETIWFKAYLSSQDFPSVISTNFYAELLDVNGKILASKTLPVFEATAAGNFDLPARVLKDAVVFRAYTAWQLNFDSTLLYTKLIPVVISTPKTAVAPGKKTYSLRFFPEGGDMIADFQSVVAFAATDDSGLPTEITGVIKDAGGKIITPFKSIHDGMGKVVLEARLHASYYAEWKDESGTTHQTALPLPKPSGVMVEVKDKENYISYILKRSDDVFPSQKKVHVIAQMHQQILYQANVSLEQTNITSGIIKTDSLTTGIMEFTVFDNEWKPLAERIIFVNKNDYSFTAAVNEYAINLSHRGKSVLEIEVPDTVSANLSLAVTDADLMTDANGEDIITRFFLSGELRGYIHNPRYYFAAGNDFAKEHLDLLMLTHGWRKYDWENIAGNRFPLIKFLPDRYLTLKGKVNGVPASALQSGNAQVNLILQTKDSAKKFLFAPISATGDFQVDGLLYYDTVSVYYQFNSNNKLNRLANVDFKTVLPVMKGAGIDTDWVAKAASIKTIGSRNVLFAQKRNEVLPELNKKIKNLEEVIVRSKSRNREEQVDKKYASGLFQGGNSKTFNLLDDPFAISALNALNYLEGKVAGLQIAGSGTEYTATWRSGTPAFFMDEMPVEIDEIASVPVSEIAMIKVFSPPFMGAFGNGAGGAIAIYRKKGGDDDVKRGARGLEKGWAVGYTPVKEFYSPDYAHFSPLHEVEDVRSTLFWEPYILTDKSNRRVKVEFYNNDISKSLRVVMEGMNENGRVVRVEKIISR
jgi:hypothetical protein